MTERPEPSLSPDALASLLLTARRACDRGNLAAARAVLHALLARAPTNTQAWLLLASVAADRAEQQAAFAHALALDPTNSLAQRGLEHIRRVGGLVEPLPANVPPLTTAPPANPPSGIRRAEPIVGPAVQLGAPAPDMVDAAPTERMSWPLYTVLGVAAVVLVLAALWIWQPKPQPSQAGLLPAGPLPSAAAQISLPMVADGGVAQPTAQISLPIVAAGGVVPTAAAPSALEATRPVAPTAAPDATTAANDRATVAPAVPNPAAPAVPIGQIVEQGPWNIGLMRPTDALVLSGSIRNLQPNGRFVLALVAISNTAASAQVLPLNLLALEDANGTRYTPVPAASTAYVSTFGAGQAGMVSMETAIPNGGVVVSVPVIFDVPPDARGLKLVVGGADDGWQVGQ